MNQFIMLGCLWLGGVRWLFPSNRLMGVNYQLGPIPSVHKPLAENSVPMGNIQTFEEVKLDLPITSGPYEPTWKSIEANYPGTPEDRSRQEKAATGMPEKCTWRGHRRMKII